MADGGDAVEILRTCASRGQAEEWALVLAAEQVPHHVEVSDRRWRLLVRPGDRGRAAEALVAYEQENRAPREAPAPAPEPGYGPSSAGLVLAGWLLAFFLVTGPRDPSMVWFEEGSAVAARIADGELWRTVTALTLHADLGHAAGNAISCAVFVTLVCRALGPGLGGALVLLSGAAGNLANAYVRPGFHDSVGASTALFGAIGILAGLALARRRVLRRQRAWIPFAAGLGLLAMLGTGARADLLAHLFGLIAGVGLGTGAGLAIPRPPGRIGQWLLAGGALGAVVACWLLALR